MEVLKQSNFMNNLKFPFIGYGTGSLPDDKSTSDLIIKAIETGYRLIDCASAYKNEQAVGIGIKKSFIPRDELFITSKVSNEERWQCGDAYQITLDAFERSINLLQLDYLDLYLIHWPVVRYHEEKWREMNAATWQAMEELYNKKIIKYIGISNFLERHIIELDKTASIKPIVNQIEIHPRYQQKDLINYCSSREIIVQAWGPLQDRMIFDIPLLNEISKKYCKSIAQIVLRWCNQMGAVPIVKSTSKERMKENLEIFDFEIEDEDLAQISTLDSSDGFKKVFSYERQQKY